MSQVIARRYRPQTFDEVIGQESTVQTIRNAILSGRIAHGFIFSGHRGIGKTTVARILAKAMNCQSFPGPTPTPCGTCDSCREIRDGNAVDVIEIDAASNRGIDEIRTLRENVRYRPARDRYKFFILDEAHQLTDDAFNALLKTLEEPPEWAVFVLATTEPEALPATIRSRCQHFSFRAVPFPLIIGRLQQICEAEGIPAEEEGLGMIAEAGDGSLRDALSLLDQAIAYGDGKITAAMARALLGRVSTSHIVELLQAVHEDSSQLVLERTHGLLSGGVSPAQLCHQMVSFVRNALVCLVAGNDTPLLELTDRERQAVAEVAGLFGEEQLARFLQILLRTAGELRHAHQERLHLELGLLKLVHARRLTSLEDVLAALQGEGSGEPREERPAARGSAPSASAPAAPQRQSFTAAPVRPPEPLPQPPAAPPPSKAGRSLSFSPSPLTSSPFSGSSSAAVPAAEKKNERVSPAPVAAESEWPAAPPEMDIPHPAETDWSPAMANPDEDDETDADSTGGLDGAVTAAPAAAPSGSAEKTQAVLAWLSEQKKTSMITIIGKAEWRWQEGKLVLVFGGSSAALAALADNEDVRKDLREACRQMQGFAPDIEVIRQEQATAAASAAARKPVMPGTAEERAQNHPLMQHLRERIAAHVLRTMEADRN